MGQTKIEYGKKHISSHGYVKVYVGRDHPLADSSGYAYEYRLVLAERLGRKPLKEEICHHGDEDKTNNDPPNIEIKIGNADHFLSHRKRQDLRKPGDPNSEIRCACGCGLLLLKYDEHNRPRRFISGYNVPIKPRELCHCGCGQKVKTVGRKYVPNHWSKRHRLLLQNEEIMCSCGCESVLMKYDRLGRDRHFIPGHNARI